MPKKTLTDSRIETINVALVQIKADLEEECLPCLRHHSKVITDTLWDMEFELEEKLDPQTD